LILYVLLVVGCAGNKEEAPVDPVRESQPAKSTDVESRAYTKVDEKTEATGQTLITDTAPPAEQSIFSDPPGVVDQDAARAHPIQPKTPPRPPWQTKAYSYPLVSFGFNQSFGPLNGRQPFHWYDDGKRHDEEKATYVSISVKEKKIFVTNHSDDSFGLLFYAGNPFLPCPPTMDPMINILKGDSMSIEVDSRGVPIVTLILKNKDPQAYANMELFGPEAYSMTIRERTVLEYSPPSDEDPTLYPLEVYWVNEDMQPIALQIRNPEMGPFAIDPGTYSGLRVPNTGKLTFVNDAQKAESFAVNETINIETMKREFPRIRLEGAVHPDTIERSVFALRSLHPLPDLIKEIKSIRWDTGKITKDMAGYVTQDQPGKIHLSAYQDPNIGTMEYLLTFMHELAHTHTFHLLKRKNNRFQKDWRNTNREKYRTRSSVQDGKHTWRDDGSAFGMKFCFASPYGATDFFEDVAEFVEVIWYADNVDWAAALGTQNSYSECYRKKVELLAAYGFITPEQRDQVLDQQEE